MNTIVWRYLVSVTLVVGCGGRSALDSSGVITVGTRATGGVVATASTYDYGLGGTRSTMGGTTNALQPSSGGTAEAAAGGSMSSGGVVATGGTLTNSSAKATGGTLATGGSSAHIPLACEARLVLGSLPLVKALSDPESMVLGDLNGDGNLDIVTISGSVLLGNGDGTFAVNANYDPGYGALALALGDLNGDGKPDIVTGNFYNNVSTNNWVGVVLGNGDGTFAAAVDYPIAGGYDAALAAPTDVNGDGKLDIATANYARDTVNVLLGNGDGTFAASFESAIGNSTPVTGPVTLSVGDMDNDGKPDLVTLSDNAGWVSVLFGNGDGSFKEALISPTASSNNPRQASVSAALGDLNGDGKLDVVAVSYNSSWVSVLLGKGYDYLATDIGFTSPIVEYSNSVTLMDLNHDNKLDLVLGSPSAVTVQLGKGDGTFSADVYYPTVTGGLATALGDLNNDGKLDVATAQSIGESGAVSVVLGTSAKTFATGVVNYPIGDFSLSGVLVDLNGDGKLDVVTANSRSNTVSVLLGRGDGTFAGYAQYATGAPPNWVTVGDVNGDGKPDAVTANASATTVSVLLGHGDGTFSAAVEYPAGVDPNYAALGDVNGDGKPDIVVSNANEVGYSGVVSILLGAGDGTFAAHVDYGVGSVPDAVALGDVNGDGKLDIVVANRGGDDDWSIGVLLGNGDGTFAYEMVYKPNGGPTSLALGDVNNDGKLDIVAGNSYADNSVSVLLGNGDATFSTTVDYLTQTGASSVALGDVNGDGKLDIVAGSVSVLLGNGDGTFTVELDYAANTQWLALGDLNGDNRPDVVVAGSEESVGVLLNSCP